MSFLWFLASGATSTLLDILLFHQLTRVLDDHIAFLLSYTACVMLRYFVDARLVLQIRHGPRSFSTYVLTNALVMMAGLLAYHAALHFVPLLPAKILSIPVTVLSGYLLLKQVVFRKPMAGREKGRA